MALFSGLTEFSLGMFDKNGVTLEVPLNDLNTGDEDFIKGAHISYNRKIVAPTPSILCLTGINGAIIEKEEAKLTTISLTATYRLYLLHLPLCSAFVETSLFAPSLLSSNENLSLKGLQSFYQNMYGAGIEAGLNKTIIITVKSIQYKEKIKGSSEKDMTLPLQLSIGFSY